VNYVLVPLNGMVSLGTAIYFLATGGGSEMGMVIVGLFVDCGICVALFLGLLNRTPWGWWLMMAVLFLKAPLTAVNKYLLASMKSDLYNSLIPSGAAPMNVSAAPFIAFAFIGFVAICLPQLVYFYKRHRLFSVDFQRG